jgi:hypothetical protein
MDKISWTNLSSNQSAIHILEENEKKIFWNNFTMNPNIFEDDIDLWNHQIRSFFCK